MRMFSQSRLRCPSSFIFSDDIKGGKLDALQNLLETYGDKKIVIIAETEDELLLLHQYLDKNKYLHEFTGTCNHDMDADFHWYRCQEAVQNFNSSAHHCILLASNIVFRSCPSLLPYTTDVVLVLSDDWFVPTDVRRCMQLGRSNPDSKLEEGEEGSGRGGEGGGGVSDLVRRACVADKRLDGGARRSRVRTLQRKAAEAVPDAPDLAARMSEDRVINCAILIVEVYQMNLRQRNGGSQIQQPALMGSRIGRTKSGAEP